MALLWRVMSAVGGTLLKVTGLFACLFLAHLVWSQAWPNLKQAADLAAQRPQIEQQVRELGAELARREGQAEQLATKLRAASDAQLARLSDSVREYEHQLTELTEQRERLLQRLRDAQADQQRYCESWNPLKRWMCREVRQRVARTVETVQPLIDSVEQATEQLRLQRQQAQTAVRDLVALDPLSRASSPQAETLRLTLLDSQRRQTQLSGALELARERLSQAKVAESSPVAWLVREVRRVGVRLLAIVLSVLLLPYLQRVLAYFVFMPWVERARALHLTQANGGTLSAKPSVRSLTVELAEGERCWSRAAYVRPVEGRTRSQWLFDWSAPFVSYAAGLSVVTRIDGPSAERPAPTRATLASPNATDSYLIELCLDNHPGVVVHPRNLVAVLGEVKLATTWRIFSLHAWATGQLRFILVQGSGRCVLEGRGDVVADPVRGGRARIEQEHVVGFDTRLAYATARTETFLPYLLGRTPLVDDVFCGQGLFVWQKNTHARADNFVQRSFDALFGAIGKLLGF